MNKQNTVPLLPCPLDAGAEDAALFGQVAAYYHERLKQTASRAGLPGEPGPGQRRAD